MADHAFGLLCHHRQQQIAASPETINQVRLLLAGKGRTNDVTDICDIAWRFRPNDH
jgi:hypothetical protein